MEQPTIAQLEAAIATNTVDAWLLRVPGEAGRERVRQALALDRRLVADYPASLASCLLARCAGEPALDDLHARWTRELTERGLPWIAALRPLSIAPGLLAELHPDASFACSEPEFESEHVLVLTSTAHSEPRPQLRWLWERGDATVRTLAPRVVAEPRLYPRFEGSWGPQLLVRSPGARPVRLPCPEGGNASARLTRDRRRILVYGSLEDGAGGFAYVVEPSTLTVERAASSRRPVLAIRECDDARMLLCTGGRTLALWSAGTVHELPVTAEDACLSPSGEQLATWSVRSGVRLWSIHALLRRAPEDVEPGFPTCFDPSGDRLLAGRRLYDGHTGALLAELAPVFGHYLEGGPARPWMQLAARYLISVHRTLQLWDARTGQSIAVAGYHHFEHWYSLAYDRDGTRLAVLCKGHKTVALWALPAAQPLGELTFSHAGDAVAVSPDGQLIAIQLRGEVELRDAAGALVRRFTHPVAGTQPSEYVPFGALTLRFSRDGRRIARFGSGDGWRIWPVDGDSAPAHVAALRGLDELDDFSVRITEWTIEATSRTVFTHRETGTQIALPVSGPWAVNPANSRIVASDGLHVELRTR